MPTSISRTGINLMARRFDLDCVHLTDDLRSHLALSSPSCHNCHGVGSYLANNHPVVCNCVLRSVFRRTLSKYREFQLAVPWLRLNVGHDATAYSFPTVEFIADFERVANATLHGLEAFVMRYHFYRGFQWRECISIFTHRHHVKVDRGLFFHAIYRVEQKLGRRFLLSPGAELYPVGKYLGATGTHTTTPSTFYRATVQRYHDPWLNGGYYQQLPSEFFIPRPRRKIIQRQVNEALIRRIGPNGTVTELPLAPAITQALAALQTSGGHPALLE